MSKLILHIGMPKTGTTALQELLTKHNQVGNVLYPNCFKDHGGLAHHEIVKLIETDYKSFIYSLQEINQHNNDIFLSSEALFHLLNKDNGNLLDKNFEGNFHAFLHSAQLAGYKIEILCTIRPLLDSIWSIYLQQIKVGNREHAKGFIEYFDNSCLYIFNRITALNFLNSIYSVKVFKYHKNINKEILKTVYDNFNPEIKWSSIHPSTTPSLLLHAFFDWLYRSNYELDNKLRWDLIGRDISGEIFDKNDNNFAELIHPKHGIFKDDLTQKLVNEYFGNNEVNYSEYLFGSQYKIYDISKYVGQDLKLDNCISFLMKNSEKYGEKTISELIKLLNEFSRNISFYIQ